MPYLLFTICLLAFMSTVRPLPVDVETTELAYDTTETPTTISEEDLVTTPSPSTSLDVEDLSVSSPSQTVEVRLHPQHLERPDRSEESTAFATATAITTTSTVEDEDDADVLGSRTFGRRMDIQPGGYGSLSGRFRSKDSMGASLRRAVNGSPAAQNLPSGRRGSLRSSSGEITPRKIVGFGNSNSNGQRLPYAGRKETFYKNRVGATSGETPASTHTDPLSPQWLYGTSKEGRRPVDPFRLSSTERWLVLGLRGERTTPYTRPWMTTTTVSPREEDASVEIDVVELTTASTTEAASPSSTTTSSITPEVNYATPEIMHATPEVNYATPELNYGIPEVNYATPETHYARSTPSSSAPEVPAAAENVTQEPETVSTTTTTEAAASDSNPFVAVKAKALAVSGESFKQLYKSPLDGKQELEASPAEDEDYADQESGVSMGQLGDGEADQDAHKYLVEEKTPDGYIVGEFGVISRSSGSLRGVRYTAHGSINPELIKEALRTFLSLK